jgi:hypothetical protein
MLPWQHGGLPEFEGSSGFLLAVLAVILVWIAFDRAPASVKCK